MEQLHRIRELEESVIAELKELLYPESIPENLVAIYHLAQVGYGKDAVRFLVMPYPRLGGEMPIVVAQSDEGVERVKTILQQGIYGVYA